MCKSLNFSQGIIVISIVVFINFDYAFAQISKGTIFLDGGINLRREMQKREPAISLASKTKLVGLLATSNVGYLLNHTLAIGVNLNMNFSREKTTYNTTPDILKNKDSDILVGPFFRYYLPFNVFAQLGYEIGFNKSKQEINSTSLVVRNKIHAFYFELGYALFLRENIALEPVLRYYYQVGKESNMLENTDTDRRALQFLLSLNFYLTKNN